MHVRRNRSIATTPVWLAALAAAGTAACLLAPSSHADEGAGVPSAGATAPASTRALEATGGGPLAGANPAIFMSGFEPPCFIGYIGGGGSGEEQNCDWHASTSAQPGYEQPRVSSASPFEGEQHLRFEYDPNQPSGADSRNWAFSDDIIPTPVPGVSYLRLEMRISAAGGANTYIIQPQAPSQELLVTQMHFNPDTTIGASDDNSDCDDNLFSPNIDTGDRWTPGEYATVEICVDTINDRIRYYYNGERVYSTGAGEGGNGGENGCGVFAGTAIEHLLIRNNDNIDDGVTVDVDNVYIITTDDGSLPCDADLSGNGQVDFDDVLIVLSDWACEGADCAGDVNGDGTTDFDDLLMVLSLWGPCPEGFICPEP